MEAGSPVGALEQLGRVAARDFGVARMQLTLFTPEEEISGAKLARQLLPRWEQWFDGEPFILPIAFGVAPREVPRLVLQSQANDLRCEISPERINIVWQRPDAVADFPADFLREATELLIEYAHLSDPRVARLAAVLTRYVVHPSPGLFLARHFCQPRWYEQPFNRPENFELHAHKRFLLASEFMVNSWVRSKTASVGGGLDRHPGIAVEQDLNTTVEEAASRAFSERDIQVYFAATARQFDETLEQYYPVTGDQS